MPKTATPKAKYWPSATRFSTATTLNGWEVVDRDGRSVTDSFSAQDKAASVAQSLNEAAAMSKQALARAFGVLLDDDPGEESDVYADELAVLSA